MGANRIPKLGVSHHWGVGWGQIQIANSNKVIIMPQNSRKRWMLELCDVMMEF